MTEQRTGHMPLQQFGAQPGERWRRFLERVGTRSNDFRHAAGARAFRLPASARNGDALVAAMSAAPEYFMNESRHTRRNGATPRRIAPKPRTANRASGTGLRSASCCSAGSPKRRCARSADSEPRGSLRVRDGRDAQRLHLRALRCRQHLGNALVGRALVGHHLDERRICPICASASKRGISCVERVHVLVVPVHLARRVDVHAH